jgi:hypothetical protein
MTKLKISIIFILLINTININAQLDSTRMKTFEDKLQVGLFLADNNASNIFTNSQGETYTQTMALKPSLGLQFAYNGAILALGTGVPIPNGRYSYDSSRTINISGYLSRPKYILWGAARRFEGLLNEEGNIAQNSEFINIAASYMYIFNENNYSFRAAYRQVDQQLTSGGSWLVKSSLSFNLLNTGSTADYENTLLRNINSQGILVLGGYGYTLNLNQNWFVSALLLGGLEYQFGWYYDRPSPSADNSKAFNSFAPTYDFKSSVGYNSDRFYISLSFGLDNRLAVNNVENIDFAHQFLKTDLRFGTRINPPKVITKIGFLNR